MGGGEGDGDTYIGRNNGGIKCDREGDAGEMVEREKM